MAIDESIPKRYVGPRELLHKSFELGKKIWSPGKVPKKMISIWRGGAPVGLCVDEYLRSRGIKRFHVVITTGRYDSMKETEGFITKGLGALIDVLSREDRVLFNDDVYDKGTTKEELFYEIKRRAGKNCPNLKNLIFSTTYWKSDVDDQKGEPDFYVERDPRWIVFPHELEDLSDKEIEKKGLGILNIINSSGFDMQHMEGEGFEYLSAEEYLRHSFMLGTNVVRSDFKPDYIVALWPGGVNPGLCIHECFKYAKHKGEEVKVPDHIAINAYHSDGDSSNPVILGLDYLEERVQSKEKILLVDSTFRSGRLVSSVVERLKQSLGRRLSKSNIKVASLYYDPEYDATWRSFPVFENPHFFIFEGKKRMIYPHSIHKLEEILGRKARKFLKGKDPELYDIVYNRD